MLAARDFIVLLSGDDRAWQPRFEGQISDSPGRPAPNKPQPNNFKFISLALVTRLSGGPKL
jgi:hypothetical protein